MKAKVEAWSNGGTNKIALHALVGGIMSDITGSGFKSGAVGAGVNEAVQKELSKIDNPALRQWASAAVGAAAAKAVNGNATSGAAVAVSGTKNNELSDIIFNSDVVSNGFKKGLKDEGIETIQAFMDIFDHPLDTLNGLKELVTEIYNDPVLIQKIGVNALEEVQQRLSTIKNGSAYETGEGLGHLSVDVGLMFVDAGLVAKLVKKVPTFSRAAKVLTNMRNGEKSVQNIEKIDVLETFHSPDTVITANRIKGSGKAVNLSDELAKSGVKYNPNDVVAITKTADGKLVWLENGNKQAGLEHILNHADDFAAKGIARGEIKDLVMTALEKGEIVGYQGKGNGRPIYEVVFKGEKQRVAITVGNNGFVVGANPQSLP